MVNNCKNIWTSVEVHGYYVESGGIVFSRQALVAKLTKEFGEDLLILSSPGLANILMFQKQTADILKLCEVENDNSKDMIKTGKWISNEIKNMPFTRTICKTNQQKWC